MELTFTLNADGEYEAKFTVNGDYAIHFERETVGGILVEHTTVNGTKYAKVASWVEYNSPLVFEHDFKNLVYPRYIRVVSATPVTNAYVTEA